MKAKKVKVFAHARGFYGRRKNCFTVAIRAVHRAWATAYTGRKMRAREYRSEWIGRINAAARLHNTNYSRLIAGLPRAGFKLNRKVLAELAVSEPYTFKAVVEATRLAVQSQLSHATKPQVLQ